MSSKNVETLRAAHKSWNKRDFAGVVIQQSSADDYGIFESSDVYSSGQPELWRQSQVLGRRESWLRISSTTGERYVPMTTLSQRKDRFVAIDFPLPLEPRSQYNGTVLPRPIYAPKAEYTQDALKAGIHGSIILKVTIAVDGSVRDVTPFVRLGYGLDESAVKAV